MMTISISPMGAVAIMLVASFLVTANDAVVKLALVNASTAEVLFFRGLFAIGAIIIYALAARSVRMLLPKSWIVAFTLSALAVLSLFLFTYALTIVPLATAVVLAYLSPIFVTALAPIVLGDTIRWPQWIAIIVSFAGVGLITTPDLTPEQFAIGGWIFLLPITVAVIIALRDLITRHHIARENVLALTVMTHMGTVIIATMSYTPEWIQIDFQQMLLYALSGLLVAGGSAGMIMALRYGDVASLASIKYSCVVWAAVLGWMIFGETMTAWEIAGACLIVLGGILIARHERVKSYG